MWPKKMFNCGDIAENPERAGKIGLSCLLGYASRTQDKLHLALILPQCPRRQAYSKDTFIDEE